MDEGCELIVWAVPRWRGELRWRIYFELTVDGEYGYAMLARQEQ